MIELTDEDATNLIRLLSASVKKAVGERIVPATDNRKQYYSKAQKVRMSSVLFAFSHTHTLASYAFLICLYSSYGFLFLINTACILCMR